MTNPQDIISGHPISFDHGIAIECGINAAIIYNHIIFWLKVNKDKPEAQKEGKVWMYQTQEKMADFFQFFGPKEVKNCIKRLIDAGLLVKKNFNTNHFDHTNWYSLSDICFQKVFSKVPKCRIESEQPGPSESPEITPSTYIEDKEKIKKACPAGPEIAASEEMFEEIPYQGRNGKLLRTTKSEIIRHCLKDKLTQEQMDAVVAKFRGRKEFVGDLYKVLDFIVTDVKAKKPSKAQKAEEKDEPITKRGIVDPLKYAKKKIQDNGPKPESF